MSDTALGRIGQIALTVHDMERGIAFWRDTVGLKFLFQAPNVAFFDVAGVRLMLGSPESADVKPAGTVLYFEVDDLDAAFARLRDRGAAVAKDGAPHFIARLGTQDLWMAFLHDPDGNMFALMAERTPG
jgi:predicted enzyme related to lactoylglutathione lyase